MSGEVGALGVELFRERDDEEGEEKEGERLRLRLRLERGRGRRAGVDGATLRGGRLSRQTSHGRMKYRGSTSGAVMSERALEPSQRRVKLVLVLRGLTLLLLLLLLIFALLFIPSMLPLLLLVRKVVFALLASVAFLPLAPLRAVMPAQAQTRYTGASKYRASR